jgi:hypothetical protein
VASQVPRCWRIQPQNETNKAAMSLHPAPEEKLEIQSLLDAIGK